MNYQQQTLVVMNSVELVVALYDGMVRFLHRAIESVEAGDVVGRRESVRRVLEILTYLQARLRADIGGKPAEALSEFYAAIYAQCVRASRDASIPLLEQSVRDVLNVRDAWKQVARTNSQGNSQSSAREGMQSTSSTFEPAGSSTGNAATLALSWMETESHRWSA
ncbi:MAG: flagellar export chaperone FliS [Acidobacteriaceae bacterium]